MNEQCEQGPRLAYHAPRPPHSEARQRGDGRRRGDCRWSRSARVRLTAADADAAEVETSRGDSPGEIQSLLLVTRSVPCRSRRCERLAELARTRAEQPFVFKAAANASGRRRSSARARGSAPRRSCQWFRDDVEHGVDAVEAIDVGDTRLAPSPRPAPCAGEPACDAGSSAPR